jgi:signal transduction histidine kinase
MRPFFKILIGSILLIAVLVSCNPSPKVVRIAFCYPRISTDWGHALRQEVLSEIELIENVDIRLIEVITNEHDYLEEEALRKLPTDSIDAVILFPRNGAAVDEEVKVLIHKGIPVIMIDRTAPSHAYTSFIGHDNTAIGKEAGIYAVNQLGGIGKVIEIKGAPYSSTSVERHMGFREIIGQHPEIQVLTEFFADWDANIAHELLKEALLAGKIPDLIYCHSDTLAAGIRQLCQSFHCNPVIIGIDGLWTPDQGIEMVLNGDLSATFFNRPGGDVAVRQALKAVNREVVDKVVLLESFPIEITNAKAIIEGFRLLEEQSAKTLQLRNRLQELSLQVKYQQLFLLAAIWMACLLVIIILLIVRSLQQKKRFISVIEKQKREIEAQKEEEHKLSLELASKNQELLSYGLQLEEKVQVKTYELAKALQKACESDQLKTAFLSNVSHELRTPLNAIIGFTEVYLGTDISQEDRDAISRILKRSCTDLLLMFNNIFEFSEIITGQKTVRYSRFALSELLTDVHREYQRHDSVSASGSEKPKLEIIYPEDTRITSDRELLLTILKHLLDNAFKYAGTGPAKVRTSIDTHRKLLRLIVEDHGPGIPSEFRSNIFGAFNKHEPVGDKLHRGTGLGLAISKGLVELLGGQIALISREGEGCRFSIEIPIHPPTLSSDLIENG